MTIVDDTPHVLTVLVGSPAPHRSRSRPINCKRYSVAERLSGGGTAQEDDPPQAGWQPGGGARGRPQRDSLPGAWTIKPDTAYFNCFYIVTSYGFVHGPALHECHGRYSLDRAALVRHAGYGWSV